MVVSLLMTLHSDIDVLSVMIGLKNNKDHIHVIHVIIGHSRIGYVIYNGLLVHEKIL